MWPPMQLARGARPIPGMRPFPPAMMGADGFPYGGVAPDGFGMPDLFGVGPRAFPPYGPRFSGDFSGPASGMMFPGRPMQPGSVFPTGGFGMMMGPGRGPFMGGMGPAGINPARAGRPAGMPGALPPPLSQNLNRLVKRDQRPSPGAGSDQGRDQESMGPSEGADHERSHQPGPRAHHEDNSLRNEESESEDEAPRRSRHGEGKKKRRGGDAVVAMAPNR